MKRLVCIFLILIMAWSCLGTVCAESNVLHLDLASATDEELAEAINQIKAEQRARIKTKVVLDHTELVIGKGKAEKVTATVQDLAEGVTAGKITAETSDKAVAAVQGNTVKGIGNGSAVITFSCTLSDGTEISEDCKVQVITPVKAIQLKQKAVEIGVGESYTPEIKISPDDATTKDLSYSSSDTSVAKIDSNGKVHAVGIGSTTITVAATDGSNVSASFTVKTSKKDDIGKTRITKDGVSVTLVSCRETPGSGYKKADAGKVFLLPEFLIENNSGKNVSVSSILCFNAYCDGYSCEYSFTAALNATGTLDGDVAAGKKMRGQAGFEVSRNWKELEVHVKLDVWGSEELVFVIYKK